MTGAEGSHKRQQVKLYVRHRQKSSRNLSNHKGESRTFWTLNSFGGCALKFRRISLTGSNSQDCPCFCAARRLRGAVYSGHVWTALGMTPQCHTPVGWLGGGGGLCTDRTVFLACCLRKLVSHLLSGLFPFRNYLHCTSIRFMLMVSIQIQFPPLITVTFNILNLVFPLNFATDKIFNNITRLNITSFSGEWFGYLFCCRRLYLS